MPHGVSEVEELAQTGLARILTDDAGLHLGRDRHRREDRAEIAGADTLERAVQLRDRLTVRDERALRDLGETRRELARRKGREDREVGEDGVRRVERADEVLPGGDIDGRFPADGGVGHAEERRGDLRDADPAEISSRHEAGDIADAAAPESDDPAVAADPLARERIPEPGRDRQPLAALAPGHPDRDRTEADRVERAQDRAFVPLRRRGVADDRHPPAPAQVREVRAHVIEQTRADQNATGAFGPGDIDANPAGGHEPRGDRASGLVDARAVDIERHVGVRVRDLALAEHRPCAIGRRDPLIRPLCHRRGDPGGHALERAA